MPGSRRLKCPRCGSNKVVPIHYGYPGPKMQSDYDAGKIDWGGCVITDNDPAWRCKECDCVWPTESAEAVSLDA